MLIWGGEGNQSVKKSDTNVSSVMSGTAKTSLSSAYRPRIIKFERNGTIAAPIQRWLPMKKTQILKPRPKLSLGDLIVAVSSCTKSTTETVATVADLLASGQVRLESDGRTMRAKVC